MMVSARITDMSGERVRVITTVTVKGCKQIDAKDIVSLHLWFFGICVGLGPQRIRLDQAIK